MNMFNFERQIKNKFVENVLRQMSFSSQIKKSNTSIIKFTIISRIQFQFMNI